MTIKKRHLSTILAFLIITALVFAGCNGDINPTPANADQTGAIILSINPEIRIEYDKDGIVTSITGNNQDGKDILGGYTYPEGASCADVVSELITLINEAGYFVDDIDGTNKTVVIQLENGSYVPTDSFMEKLRTEAENAADTLDVNPEFVAIGKNDYDKAYDTDSTPSPYITADKAMEIALSHAGILSEDAKFAEKEYDIDDNTPIYEIEFSANGYEFDYDIHAETGKVVETDKEREKSSNGNSDSGSQGSASASKYITLKKAKEIALEHSGVKSADAHFKDKEFDLDDGTPYYELEFNASGYEYEYEIHAVSGKVIDYDKDYDEDYNKNNNKNQNNSSSSQNKSESNKSQSNKSESNKTQNNKTENSNSQNNNAQTDNSPSYIGLDKAKSIALEHAGVAASDTSFEDRDFDLDDGTPYYELEFRANGYKYEYDIHAVSGKVVDSERERIDDDDDDDRKNQSSNSQNNSQSKPQNNSQDNNQSNTTSYIGIDRAKEIALEHAEVSASDARFEKGEFDKDDGTALYELEFKANGYEYEYSIHAVSGKILDSERDTVDDD